MFQWIIFLSDYTQQQILLITLCAFLVGVSKTGVPGIGILNVPLMALGFSAKMSTGLLLPLLAMADIFPAVVYYHRHAHWHHIWRLFAVGIGWDRRGFGDYPLYQ